MALIKCVDCGRDVSDAAPACPGCGRPIGAAPRHASPAAPALVRTEGAGARDKLIGLLLCLAGVISAAAGFSTSSGGAWTAVGVIGILGLLVGLIYFIKGRLSDG